MKRYRPVSKLALDSDGLHVRPCPEQATVGAHRQHICCVGGVLQPGSYNNGPGAAVFALLDNVWLIFAPEATSAPPAQNTACTPAAVPIAP